MIISLIRYGNCFEAGINGTARRGKARQNNIGCSESTLKKRKKKEKKKKKKRKKKKKMKKKKKKWKNNEK